MKNLTVELKKCKRTGILVVLPLVGLLGALYAFVNFIVRKEVLLSLPLPPMDVLLTQLYGMVMVLNMFGIIVATTLTYNMEFQGNAIKKMYMLPFKTSTGRCKCSCVDNGFCSGIWNCNTKEKPERYFIGNELGGRRKC